MAVKYGIEKYHSGTPNSITVTDYSSFNTQTKVDALKVIIDNTLEPTEGAAITQALTFTIPTQVASMKFIVEHELLATASIITGALLYTDNTKLLALITNQSHSVASVKTSDPVIDAIVFGTAEWDDIVEQYKHQIRNGDDTKLIAPNVAVFGEDALDPGKGLVGLTTTTKVSIVAAINELVGGGGFIAGNGLTSSGSTINVVSANTAILANTDDIELSLKSNPGLEISSGLGVLLDTDSGLGLAAGGLSIGNGDGLSALGGTLSVDLATNSGLAFATNQLTIDLRDTEPGLELIASGVGVLLKTSNSGLGVKLTATPNKGGLEFDGSDGGLGASTDDYSVGISVSGELRSVLAAQKAPLLASVCAMGGATSNPTALLELFKNNVNAGCDSSATSLVTTPPNTLPGNDRVECLTYIVHIASGVGGAATVNLAADNGVTPSEKCSEMFDCAFDEMTTSGQIKTGMQQNVDLKNAIEGEICAQHLM